MRKNNFMNKIIKLKGSILAGIIPIIAMTANAFAGRTGRKEIANVRFNGS